MWLDEMLQALTSIHIRIVLVLLEVPSTPRVFVYWFLKYIQEHLTQKLEKIKTLRWRYNDKQSYILDILGL